MKRSLLLLLVFATLTSSAALATTYQTVCTGAACKPFTASNSFVAQLAVNLAFSNNAPVGSTIEVWFVPPPPTNNCEERVLVWTVNHVPTLNSTHLTFVQGYCVN